jgi:hypothetical protein
MEGEDLSISMGPSSSGSGACSGNWASHSGGSGLERGRAERMKGVKMGGLYRNFRGSK